MPAEHASQVTEEIIDRIMTGRDNTGTVYTYYGDYNFHSCPLLFVIKFHASLL